MKWLIWLIETYVLDALILSIALVVIEELIRYRQ
jgi:hypothetical protein